MKKILLVTASMIALSATAASAADLAARPYTKAPPPMVAAVYDWTGFYIGINGGWGQSHDNRSVDGVGGVGSYDANGGTVGGQIGYRWQTGGWVWGLEAQGNWADFSGSTGNLLVPGGTVRSKTDAFGLFTGQIATPGTTSCCTPRAVLRSPIATTSSWHRAAPWRPRPATTPVGARRSALASNSPSRRLVARRGIQPHLRRHPRRDLRHPGWCCRCWLPHRWRHRHGPRPSELQVRWPDHRQVLILIARLIQAASKTPGFGPGFFVGWVESPG